MADTQRTSFGVPACNWCDRAVAAGEGYRVLDERGDRHSVFCRLEHVVPWAMRGARWLAGPGEEPYRHSGAPECAHCGLGEARVVVVHHRGEHRVSDAFCSVDHASAWAKAGGRYARP